MAIFNFELTRTYSTMFEIEADTQLEAIKLFNELGDEIYAEELKQCNVIEEVVKGDKYAHLCDCCGNGMNDGYFIDYMYYCSDTCLHTEYTPEEWKNLYEQSEEQGGDYCYWTQWEDESDYQYQIINGKLEEMDEVSYGN
jgi:hypothetical protein